MIHFLALLLRFGQFAFAAVVLGFMAYFLNIRDETNQGPIGREIYTLLVAIFSVLASLAWMLPLTITELNYPFDFLFSMAWFAAFGVLVDWLHITNCGPAFSWRGLHLAGYCNHWKASEAFSFLSAIFWLGSALLGMYLYHHRTRAAVT
jgi:hypothetical protein